MTPETWDDLVKRFVALMRQDPDKFWKLVREAGDRPSPDDRSVVRIAAWLREDGFRHYPSKVDLSTVLSRMRFPKVQARLSPTAHPLEQMVANAQAGLPVLTGIPVVETSDPAPDGGVETLDERLRRYIKNADDGRPYACPAPRCGGFRTSEELIRHARAAHGVSSVSALNDKFPEVRR